MTFSASERRRLAELFRDLGPSAPTLCEGWTTHDLVAHLYVRENQPLAAAGMFLPPLSSRLVKAVSAQKDRGFDELVADWEKGPGRFNPLRFADRAVNTLEHFVHHEDARRGGGEVHPRDFSAAVDKELMARLGKIAPLMLKGSDKPVVLTAPNAAPVVVNSGRKVADAGDDVVRVYGDPGELVLWTFGRDAVEVRIDGDVNVVNR